MTDGSFAGKRPKDVNPEDTYEITFVIFARRAGHGRWSQLMAWVDSNQARAASLNKRFPDIIRPIISDALGNQPQGGAVSDDRAPEPPHNSGICNHSCRVPKTDDSQWGGNSGLAIGRNLFALFPQ